jgi:hypothetical protein
MILDGQNLMSDAQALTSTAASTNVIDLGADNNVGIGEAMAVVVQLDVAADDADADETYVVAVQTDDNAAFSSAASVGSITIAAGDAAGTRYSFLLPKDTSMERYLRLNYTLGGTSPSVTVTSFLIPADGLEAYVSYPKGYTISG